MVKSKIINDKEQKTWYLFEDRQRFSKSIVWKLQNKYYEDRGADAWRQGEVPHYVTTNPTIAANYAELVVALYKDFTRNKTAPVDPFYIIELGAGTGRFGFYFLKQLEQICKQEEIPFESFQYVLTDFTKSNLDFWRNHRCLRPYFESGHLDMGLFDMIHSRDLQLEIKGKTIAEASLVTPITIIANYVFDSIPQDIILYTKNKASPCDISVYIDKNPEEIEEEDMAANLMYDYHYNDSHIFFEEEYLQNINSFYSNSFEEAHVLFPADGLRCLEHLRSYSANGALLLTADKGDHTLSALDQKGAPAFAHHGNCFSLNVNYHAFKLHCELTGGQVFFPDHHYIGINVGCLLFMPHGFNALQLHSAYQKNINRFGPDDYFSIANYFRENLAALNTDQSLAFLRLSRYDSHQLALCLTRFVSDPGAFNSRQKQDIISSIHHCWENYFPLGEELDLANRIALFLYELGEFKLALIFFSRSTQVYGTDLDTLFNMSLCFKQLMQWKNAAQLLEKLLENDPQNADALLLLSECRENLH